ncbi:hypothetical protein BLA29_001655, partial [Euroglyphus maynei]
MLSSPLCLDVKLRSTSLLMLYLLYSVMLLFCFFSLSFSYRVYGDVIRVKILFNKKDTALIQMAEPNQAQNAISYLDRTRLFGKTIHVMSSKHQMVQMPKEGHQDSGLTKDYANSPLH